MKKVFTLIAVVLMAVTSVKAQIEVGGVVGGMYGASVKYWLNDKLALQGDLAVGLTRGNGAFYFKGAHSPNGGMSLYDFTINPNALYHFDLPANFKVYCGGGINFGLVSDLNNTDPAGIFGKFGINAVGGVSYDLQQFPLTFAFDFRPGYGLGFQTANDPHISYFDWKLALAIRYRF
jgi:hypothetical protein